MTYEDIENLCNMTLHEMSYDDKYNSEKIDKFVKRNLHIRNWRKLQCKMRAFSKESKITIRKVDLVASYNKQNMDCPDFFKIIQKRAMRSQSGVLVCTVFTDAFPKYNDGENIVTQMFSCKHDCFFCPSEPARAENNWIAQPRSYLSNEPGVARACSVNYDCVAQMKVRMKQYQRMGHKIDKLEVLVLGGTWSEYPKTYQIEFCRNIYYSANTFFHTREERFPLETEILLNEYSEVSVIGLTLETRPDTITLDEIKNFRQFGCTRIQMGAQHTNDRILKMSNRGHKVQHTIDAIRLLKNNGYKIDLHVMPNLYGSSPEIDIKMLGRILYDQELQVDQLKLYPVSVVPWSKYEKLFKNGIYKPYDDEQLKNVLLWMKRRIHPWIRLNRVIRDIPIESISGGCQNPNMRQDLSKIANCRCIRCREVKDKVAGEMELKIREYAGSDGREIFLSYESKDEKIIYGFLRLRLQVEVSNPQKILPELQDSALIRELHVYGNLSKKGDSSDEHQHRGIGTKLIKEAEYISMFYGFESISVISGIGVRNYYRKRGFTETTEYGYLKKRFTFLDYLKFLLNKMIRLWFLLGFWLRFKLIV